MQASPTVICGHNTDSIPNQQMPFLSHSRECQCQLTYFSTQVTSRQDRNSCLPPYQLSVEKAIHTCTLTSWIMTMWFSRFSAIVPSSILLTVVCCQCHCLTTAVCQSWSQWDRSFQNKITHRHLGYFLLSQSVAGGSNKRSLKLPGKGERKEKRRRETVSIF